jgi:hypothetical protein
MSLRHPVFSFCCYFFISETWALQYLFVFQRPQPGFLAMQGLGVGAHPDLLDVHHLGPWLQQIRSPVRRLVAQCRGVRISPRRIPTTFTRLRYSAKSRLSGLNLPSPVSSDFIELKPSCRTSLMQIGPRWKESRVRPLGPVLEPGPPHLSTKCLRAGTRWRDA